MLGKTQTSLRESPEFQTRMKGGWVWSMVSNAADRSRRQRHDNFFDPMALMRWSWIYSRAVSVEWCLQ